MDQEEHLIEDNHTKFYTRSTARHLRRKLLKDAYRAKQEPDLIHGPENGVKGLTPMNTVDHTTEVLSKAKARRLRKKKAQLKEPLPLEVERHTKPPKYCECVLRKIALDFGVDLERNPSYFSETYEVPTVRESYVEDSLGCLKPFITFAELQRFFDAVREYTEKNHRRRLLLGCPLFFNVEEVFDNIPFWEHKEGCLAVWHPNRAIKCSNFESSTIVKESVDITRIDCELLPEESTKLFDSYVESQNVVRHTAKVVNNKDEIKSDSLPPKPPAAILTASTPKYDGMEWKKIIEDTKADLNSLVAQVDNPSLLSSTSKNTPSKPTMLDKKSKNNPSTSGSSKEEIKAEREAKKAAKAAAKAKAKEAKVPTEERTEEPSTHHANPKYSDRKNDQEASEPEVSQRSGRTSMEKSTESKKEERVGPKAECKSKSESKVEKGTKQEPDSGYGSKSDVKEATGVEQQTTEVVGKAKSQRSRKKKSQLKEPLEQSMPEVSKRSKSPKHCWCITHRIYEYFGTDLEKNAKAKSEACENPNVRQKCEGDSSMWLRPSVNPADLRTIHNAFVEHQRQKWNSGLEPPYRSNFDIMEVLGRVPFWEHKRNCPFVWHPSNAIGYPCYNPLSMAGKSVGRTKKELELLAEERAKLLDNQVESQNVVRNVAEKANNEDELETLSNKIENDNTSPKPLAFIPKSKGLVEGKKIITDTNTDLKTTVTHENPSLSTITSKNTPSKPTTLDKKSKDHPSHSGCSKEEIKAEREAKKAAKAAAKAKAKETKVSAKERAKEPSTDQANPKSQNDQEVPANEASQRVSKPLIEKPTESRKEERVAPETEGKSKAELRAERRAKQEAQRAAKKQQSEKVISKNVQAPPAAISADPDTTSQKPAKKPAVQKTSHEVNLFKHLYDERQLALVHVSPVNSNIHPAIVRLGVQYADKVIVGSNARCVALLAAVKRLIEDFQRPPHADFIRGLEASLQESVAYLHHCRPLAVSMQNALRHFKWQMTQLPSTISDKDAKGMLECAVDTYITEQIELADKAISLTIQTKISDGNVILTYGYSSLIHKILLDAHTAGKKFRVVVVDGRPWLEGREQLRRLAKHGIECSYILINALSFIMPEVSKVFLGAHAILANGAVMSRVGTAQIALMARAFNVPVLVACETHKSCERVQTDSIVYNELGNADDLAQTRSNGKKSLLANWRTKKYLNLLNITYDVTPADLVTAVVTELAILPCTSVPVILRIKPSEI